VPVGAGVWPLSREAGGRGSGVPRDTRASWVDVAESGTASGSLSSASGGVTGSGVALVMLSAGGAGALDVGGATVAGLAGVVVGVGSGSAPHPTQRSAAITVRPMQSPLIPHITTRVRLVSVSHGNHIMLNDDTKVNYPMYLCKHFRIWGRSPRKRGPVPYIPWHFRSFHRRRMRWPPRSRVKPLIPKIITTSSHNYDIPSLYIHSCFL